MFDRRLLSNFDWVLYTLMMAIAFIGVAAIYSASKGYVDDNQYWLRQLFWIAAGTGVGFAVLLFDFRTIGNWAYILHGGVVVSLLVLWGTGGASGAGGVNRWFLVGPVAVQPSEIVKLTMVLAIAHYFRDSRRSSTLGFRGVLWPAAIMLVPFMLIVRQPDLGTALLLFLIFVPLMLFAGVRWRLVAILGAAGVLAIGALIASFQLGYYEVDGKVTAMLRRGGAEPVVVGELKKLEGERFALKSSFQEALLANGGGALSERQLASVESRAFRPYISDVLRPYQQRRLITFVNPDHDPLGAGYHVIQSKVAVGSGMFWGKGYGESTQGSLNFLPARHTDFLFSIFAEEWGFVGASGLILLYLLLILRGLSIILQTHDRFSAFLILGVLSILTFQVVINMGMALGLLPVVGVPLPLFSYGGSSMITIMGGLALILNIRMRRFLWS